MNGRQSLVAVALAVSACGGSASETPPPLEPLPKHLRRPSSLTVASAPTPRRGAGIGTDETADAPPAEATWGVEPPQSLPGRLPDAGLR